MRYYRPYIRKSVREAILARAPRNEQGQFIDPNTNEPIPDKYDLGHKSGHEYRSLVQWAKSMHMTQQEFNDYVNNPDFYQIEAPSSNRSHAFEQETWTPNAFFTSPEFSQNFSHAEIAYELQGGDAYPGRDTWQNGVIPKGQDTTLYFSHFDSSTKATGFLTDQSTIDHCTHNGVLNANELADKLQLAPSDRNSPDSLYHRPEVTALNVDWNRLESLRQENPELYNALTDGDGNLKCAFGKTEANTQYGDGGGNQYLFDRESLEQAIDQGVFKPDADKSYSEADGNLTREGIPNTPEYRDAVSAETTRVGTQEEQKPVPSTDQLNSTQVRQDADMPYVAQPDKRYPVKDHAAEETEAPGKDGTETQTNPNNATAPMEEASKNTQNQGMPNTAQPDQKLSEKDSAAQMEKPGKEGAEAQTSPHNSPVPDKEASKDAPKQEASDNQQKTDHSEKMPNQNPKVSSAPEENTMPPAAKETQSQPSQGASEGMPNTAAPKEKADDKASASQMGNSNPNADSKVESSKGQQSSNNGQQSGGISM